MLKEKLMTCDVGEGCRGQVAFEEGRRRRATDGVDVASMWDCSTRSECGHMRVCVCSLIWTLLENSLTSLIVTNPYATAIQL